MIIRGEAPDGRVYIRCPWESEHTSKSDDTATVYFPAGTGGYELGHFQCLHAHCQSKTDGDFFDAIGWTRHNALGGFEEVLPSGINEAESINLEHEPDLEDLIGRDPSLPALMDDPPRPAYVRTQGGVITPIVNNLLTWLRTEAVTVAFDVFRDEMMIYTEYGRRPFTDSDYIRLISDAEAHDFGPIKYDTMRRCVRKVAQERCFDSAKEWLTCLPAWDKTERIDGFCRDYLGARMDKPGDPAYACAVSRYIWTAMAGRILDPGSKVDMLPILVSPQGTGKSTAVRAMAPNPDYFIEISFSEKDADLARLTRGKTTVEVAELRGLRTRDIETIKAFATRQDDEWVPKYMEMRTKYPRRFLMIGTTNDPGIIDDYTGARRWVPISVERQDVDAIREDHDQLWAEARDLYLRRGILWEDAQRLAQNYHTEFEAPDIFDDLVGDWLDQEGIDKQSNRMRPFLRIADLMRDIPALQNSRTNRADQMRVASSLTRLGYERKQKWINNRTQKVWIHKKGGYG